MNNEYRENRHFRHTNNRIAFIIKFLRISRLFFVIIERFCFLVILPVSGYNIRNQSSEPEMTELYLLMLLF